MPPLYNHGHADALSIILNKNGKKFLVDPGTYVYNTETEWRRYFKGTRAHNTVNVDNCDQAVQETGFIWSHPYNAELLGFSETTDHFIVNAAHDGYKRLKEPIEHKRNIIFFNDKYLLIKDSFEGQGVHNFEINYHLHPNVNLAKRNNWWQLNNEGKTIFMRLLEEDDFSTVRGSIDPMHGWYSPHYGKKLACDVMYFLKKGNPHEISFTTAVCTDELIDEEKFEEKLIYLDSTA